MSDQYEFKTVDDRIIGELVGETENEWIVRLENKDIKTIHKKDIIDCRILYPRKVGTFEAIQDTIQSMLKHGM